MSESDLWSFSLSVYAMPGVADACLKAQDEAGADVNLLLWSIWLAILGHELTGQEVASAMAATEPWRDEIVRPLRTIRRRLKSGPPPAPSAGTDQLRQQIKAVELEAERQQLLMLQSLPSARRCGPAIIDLLIRNLALLPGGDILADVTIPLHANLRDCLHRMVGSGS